MESKDRNRISKLAESFHVCQPNATFWEHRDNQNLFVGDGLINIDVQDNDPSCQGSLCNVQKLCSFMIGYKRNQQVRGANATDLDILVAVADKQRYWQKQEQVSDQKSMSKRRLGGSNNDVANFQVNDDDNCLQVDWAKTLEELSQPVVTDGGWRSWLWQTCTEVGFYQTCQTDDCPFGRYYHLVDMDLQICQAAYNFTTQQVYENIAATKDYYGGLDIRSASRVLSVNGNVDPWSTLAIQSSPRYDLPVELVAGASHHFWTHAVRDTDSPEIVQIREYIYSVVMEWMGLKNDGDDDTDGDDDHSDPLTETQQLSF